MSLVYECLDVADNLIDDCLEEANNLSEMVCGLVELKPGAFPAATGKIINNYGNTPSDRCIVSYGIKYGPIRNYLQYLATHRQRTVPENNLC
ncbi:hypothetical protein CEXT_573951 [Caerostris extrusa]|uniref:Uncharacterized protein n=1 Tax=Caerostris extrusa TaxID=172846 RepID=A0AAV4MU51_CAEEX|nr:hypothetical protein CEXT_573951 [Caerostris extrusa]